VVTGSGFIGIPYPHVRSIVIFHFDHLATSVQLSTQTGTEHPRSNPVIHFSAQPRSLLFIHVVSLSRSKARRDVLEVQRGLLLRRGSSSATAILG